MKRVYILAFIIFLAHLILAQSNPVSPKHYIILTDGRIFKGNVDFTHYYFKKKIALNDTLTFDLVKVKQFSCDLGQFEYSFDIGKKHNVKYTKRVLFYQLPSEKIFLFYPWDETFTKEGLATKKPSFYKMNAKDNMKKITLNNLLKDLKGTKYETDLRLIGIRKSHLNRLLFFQMLAMLIAVKEDFSGGKGDNPFKSIGDYFNPFKKPVFFMGFTVTGSYFFLSRKFEKQIRNILIQFDRE